jgi:predicted LPLAT superfamily acyltransferase
MQEKEWAGNTFGTGFMHRWLIKMLRHTDVRLWYVFTAVFILPFCMLFSAGARTTWHYLRHRQHKGRFSALVLTYTNLVLFSQVVIDKFALFAGKKMSLKIQGYDVFKNLADKEAGFVMLSAHIGCYEMAGYELVSDKKSINALVFKGEKESVMQGRKKLFSGNNIKMIPVSKDMSHLFKIDQALVNGEIVSIPADRVFGSPRTIPVTLLGATAELPLGPFRVPAMRGLAVIAVNVMKTGCREYTAYLKRLDYDTTAQSKTQVRQLADAYAQELERMLKLYPTQWYNYFEFWK